MLTETTRRPLLFLVAALVALAMGLATVEAGSSQDGGSQSTSINTMCPLLPDEPVDPRYIVTYQGQEIGLCCVKCKRKFLKDPEAWVGEIEGFQPQVGVQSIALPVEGAGADESQGEGLGLVASLGRFHPMAVHIPLGLFFAAALAELLYILRADAALRKTAAHCWYLALAGAVVAALLGLATATELQPSDPAIADMLSHRNAGFATLLLAICSTVGLRNASAADSEPKHQLLWRVGLFATVAVVGLTGHLGGILVFGPDHLPI